MRPATFTVTADPGAAEVKDHRVTVSADAPGVTKATETFLLTVRKKG